jgi:Polyketide cyclase / dehydrase and lipid transport
VRPSVALAASLLLASPGARADLAKDAERQGDIDMSVSLDSGAQSGRAAATVRIHAHPETIWPVLTTCAQALKLVPGLISCEVIETAPDGSSQLIREIVDYSWILPKLTYEIRAHYDYPTRVSIERVSGDLRTLKCSWYLEADGDYTVAHYSLDLTPGIWVPHWMVRLALRHDLPKMLREVRARAEAGLDQGS